jgi:bifunctional non-homologous end joining protein LigD
VLILAGLNVMNETLERRRELLQKKIVLKLEEPIRFSPELEASLPALGSVCSGSGLEGLVAKRRDSTHQPGLRSGAWQKMRIKTIRARSS